MITVHLWWLNFYWRGWAGSLVKWLAEEWAKAKNQACFFEWKYFICQIMQVCGQAETMKSSGLTSFPVEQVTKQSDTRSPLIPFIKETVRKDTTQEKHQPSFHIRLNKAQWFLPITPPPKFIHFWGHSIYTQSLNRHIGSPFDLLSPLSLKVNSSLSPGNTTPATALETFSPHGLLCHCFISDSYTVDPWKSRG